MRGLHAQLPLRRDQREERRRVRERDHRWRASRPRTDLQLRKRRLDILLRVRTG